MAGVFLLSSKIEAQRTVTFMYLGRDGGLPSMVASKDGDASVGIVVEGSLTPCFCSCPAWRRVLELGYPLGPGDPLKGEHRLHAALHF